MTKLCVSAHSLAIEKGRYSRPPTLVAKRICLHCPRELIEDDLQFLTECQQYNTQTHELYEQILEKCQLFQSLSMHDNLVYMLSAGMMLPYMLQNLYTAIYYPDLQNLWWNFTSEFPLQA